eukprot:355115-Chlamydomonas_euryale.AAC.3
MQQAMCARIWPPGTGTSANCIIPGHDIFLTPCGVTAPHTQHNHPCGVDTQGGVHVVEIIRCAT